MYAFEAIVFHDRRREYFCRVPIFLLINREIEIRQSFCLREDEAKLLPLCRKKVVYPVYARWKMTNGLVDSVGPMVSLTGSAVSDHYRRHQDVVEH